MSASGLYFGAAGLAVVIGVRSGGRAASGLVLAVWAVGLVCLAVADFVGFRLPKRVVYATLAATTPLLVMAACYSGEWGRVAAAVGVALGLEILFATWALLWPGSLGFGDVRLVGLIGLGAGWVSPGLAVVAVMGGLSLAATVGVVGVAARWWSWRQRLPLGAFLVVGALSAVAVHS